MRAPTTREWAPLAITLIVIAASRLLVALPSDLAKAAGSFLAALGGILILFGLYRLAPWIRGE
jgi:hypothetical protein